MKQSIEWIKCVGPEGQIEILKPCVAGKAMNVSGRDLLQWEAQINNPTLSKTACKMMLKIGYIPGKGILKNIKEIHRLHRLSNSRTK